MTGGNIKEAVILTCLFILTILFFSILTYKISYSIGYDKGASDAFKYSNQTIKELKNDIKDCAEVIEQKDSSSKMMYEEILTQREQYRYDLLMLNITKMNVSEIPFIDGFYSPKGFYCVATFDKNKTEIELTANHEILHSLISKDKKHFCS